MPGRANFRGCNLLHVGLGLYEYRVASSALNRSGLSPSFVVRTDKSIFPPLFSAISSRDTMLHNASADTPADSASAAPLEPAYDHETLGNLKS